MQVGSIVECINDNFSGIHPLQQMLYNGYPVKGEYYIIRELFDSIENIPGVRLEEIVNRTNPLSNNEQGYLASRFREVLPPELLVIEKILNNSIEV